MSKYDNMKLLSGMRSLGLIVQCIWVLFSNRSLLNGHTSCVLPTLTPPRASSGQIKPASFQWFTKDNSTVDMILKRRTASLLG